MQCNLKGHSGSFISLCFFFIQDEKPISWVVTGANRKQTATVTLHQVAGLSAGGRCWSDSRWEVGKEKCGQP